MPKIKYWFADRTSSEVEVSEEFYLTYQAFVDKEKRINRSETRRHQSLDKSLEHGWDIPDTSANVELAAEQNELRELLHKALKQLTDKQRIALICHDIYEQSFNEVGKKMGINKQMANKHYLAAIKKMKKILKNR